ncbi:MAG: helix-turn-helix domain-containing protein [Nitratireductor sp.]
MSKCEKGGLQSRTVAEFDASAILGTPFSVVLHNAVKEKMCPKTGIVLGHVLPMPEKLISVAAILRTCEPIKLNGSEIKFLRKSMDLKAKDLADRLCVSPEQYSRYENDKLPISNVYEKLLRGEVCLHHLDNVKHIDIDIRGVMAMKIQSAHDIEKPVVLRLAPVFVDQDKPVEKWKKQVA